MEIKFHKLSDFERIKFSDLLADAYSFNKSSVDVNIERWRENDNFFYDYVGLKKADTCCIITTLNDEIIGFICWDPRNLPEYAIIGDNCIVTKHKGKGFGKLQLQEAVNRIIQNGGKKIYVTTNEGLFPATKMYESVGFNKMKNLSLPPNQTASNSDIHWGEVIHYSMDIENKDEMHETKNN